MREHKYRFWDKQDKKMIYAEEAVNSKEVFAIGLHGLPIVIDEDSFNPYSSKGVTAWNIDNRMLPMQSLGHTDINGKEIYESDLVQDIDGIIDVVEWVEDIDTDRDWQHCTGFLIDLRRSIYCKDSRLNVEIVGNLYETPHLAPEEVR